MEYHHLYLLLNPVTIREKNGIDVIKLGRTKCIKRRIGEHQITDDQNVIILFRINEFHVNEAESKLRDEFNKMFEKFEGNEYYIGNITKMSMLFNNILMNYMIKSLPNGQDDKKVEIKCDIQQYDKKVEIKHEIKQDDKKIEIKHEINQEIKQDKKKIEIKQDDKKNHNKILDTKTNIYNLMSIFGNKGVKLLSDKKKICIYETIHDKNIINIDSIQNYFKEDKDKTLKLLTEYIELIIHTDKIARKLTQTQKISFMIILC